jgi:hypothetical protein
MPGKTTTTAITEEQLARWARNAPAAKTILENYLARRAAGENVVILLTRRRELRLYPRPSRG